jgi:hypothetical protein
MIAPAVAGRVRWGQLLSGTARPQQLAGRRPRSQRPRSGASLRCRGSTNNPDKSVHQSFDSEEELDLELTSEFERLANPKRMQQAAAHLDLAWKIGKAGACAAPRSCRRLRSRRRRLAGRCCCCCCCCCAPAAATASACT